MGEVGGAAQTGQGQEGASTHGVQHGSLLLHGVGWGGSETGRVSAVETTLPWQGVEGFLISYMVTTQPPGGTGHPSPP